MQSLAGGGARRLRVGPSLGNLCLRLLLACILLNKTLRSFSHARFIVASAKNTRPRNILQPSVDSRRDFLQVLRLEMWDGSLGGVGGGHRHAGLRRRLQLTLIRFPLSLKFLSQLLPRNDFYNRIVPLICGVVDADLTRLSYKIIILLLIMRSRRFRTRRSMIVLLLSNDFLLICIMNLFGFLLAILNMFICRLLAEFSLAIRTLDAGEHFGSSLEIAQRHLFFCDFFGTRLPLLLDLCQRRLDILESDLALAPEAGHDLSAAPNQSTSPDPMRLTSRAALIAVGVWHYWHFIQAISYPQIRK